MSFIGSGSLLGTLILLHFQPASLCPVDRESPKAERLWCLCLRLESMPTPAVGDLQGEGQHVGRAPGVSVLFVFEASTRANKDVSTRGLTALYK